MAARKSMQVVIPSTFVHRKFAELSRRVFSGREHFVVEKEGMPIMAIISIAEYEEFMKEQERKEQEERERDERLQRFERAARKFGTAVERSGLSEEQLLAELEEDKKTVHQRHYGNTSK